MRFPRLRAVAPLAVPPFALCLFLFLACSDTPRGEQGIDFVNEAGTDDANLRQDVNPDAKGPCAESADAGACSQAAVSGIPATHLVTCAGSEGPALLVCVATMVPPATGAAYCCTTGLL